MEESIWHDGARGEITLASVRYKYYVRPGYYKTYDSFYKTIRSLENEYKLFKKHRQNDGDTIDF